MTRRLFGTDGVRGVAGELLSAELALGLGRAATRRLQVKRPQVLILRDTRESGPMLEAALAAGVASAGGDVLLGGVLPTPAAPLLIDRYGLQLAAVISASHNPYRDNGIKFFGADGYKLSDEAELQIERELEHDRERVANAEAGAGEAGKGEAGKGEAGAGEAGAGEAGASRQASPQIGRIRELRGADEDYLRELHARFSDLDLTGLDAVLDCANGATYEVAPEIFRRLGASVTVIADAPDGRNINDGCGSTHVQRLAERVLAGGHALGFAFDGDGDRVLAVDGAGGVVDGDELIALAALHLRESGRLTGGGVAVTVMTNYGFHSAMSDAGIEVASTKVGDRYVLEELRARGWTLGGEQSGHLIDLGFNRTGDGIAGALLTLEALAGADLRERGAMAKLPQRLVNVRVRDRQALHRAQEVTAAVRAADEALAGRGRVLVRPSGTEPLVRVMVEAPTDAEAQEVCDRLVGLVERELG
ncbi:MAG TPA: phosphoglucosamine mutase [Solirubrobacteraceae bacterium]|nr:phosphoglucosamine mutase [Solirubrobacteraceae bacterium]